LSGSGNIIRTDAERILTLGEVKKYLIKKAHYQNFVERYVQATVKLRVPCFMVIASNIFLFSLGDLVLILISEYKV
jgi:hypothetical protein